MTKIEQKAFNYASEKCITVWDYSQIYDAFLAGENELKKCVEEILDDVFYEIKMGHIERALDAYDEIEKQLKDLFNGEK